MDFALFGWWLGRLPSPGQAAWNAAALKPFMRAADPNFLLVLQGLLHEKPQTIDLRTIPSIDNLIYQHIYKADIALCGAHVTQLKNAEIEKTEFDLAMKKFRADIMAYDVYARKCRSGQCLDLN